LFISCNQGTWSAKTPNKIKFRYFLKCVNDLVKDYEKPDCAACSSSSELEHFADETDNVESSNTPEDNNRSNTAEKGMNTAIIWNRSRKIQTEKTETRTFPMQTHLQVNTNCSLFEKSASLKYDKKCKPRVRLYRSKRRAMTNRQQLCLCQQKSCHRMMIFQDLRVR
jgi:hypothetical protein